MSIKIYNYIQRNIFSILLDGNLLLYYNVFTEVEYILYLENKIK